MSIKPTKLNVIGKSQAVEKPAASAIADVAMVNREPEMISRNITMPIILLLSWGGVISETVANKAGKYELEKGVNSTNDTIRRTPNGR